MAWRAWRHRAWRWLLATPPCSGPGAAGVWRIPEGTICDVLDVEGSHGDEGAARGPWPAGGAPPVPSDHGADLPRLEHGGYSGRMTTTPAAGRDIVGTGLSRGPCREGSGQSCLQVGRPRHRARHHPHERPRGHVRPDATGSPQTHRSTRVPVLPALRRTRRWLARHRSLPDRAPPDEWHLCGYPSGTPALALEARC